MSRVRAFLAGEIRWGRMAWLALVVALLAGFVYTGAVAFQNSLLYYLTLLIYAGGGFFVERFAPRHPFWNALFYCLFCILFTIALLMLNALGATGVISLEAMGIALWMAFFFILPQSLVGTWMAVTFRRVREMRQESTRKKGEEATGKPTPRPSPRQRPAGRSRRR